ncbi:MAG: hypothetical protein ABSH20_08695 [Tepidisphaeraceae bacterium]|jgi:ribosomal protein L7/L12
MSEQLKAALRTLRKCSPELNKLTDEANALAQKVESLLLGLSLGIPAAVHVKEESCRVVPDTGNEPAGLRRKLDVYLEYRRIDKKFGIAVVRTQTTERRDDDGEVQVSAEDTDVTPWASSPRDVKLDTFARFPDLIGAIAEKAGAYIERAKEAGETVRALVAAMEDPSVMADPPSEEQRALLARLPEERRREIEEHMHAGRGLVAIRIFREYTGATIAAAKEAVERIAPNLAEEGSVPAAEKVRGK